MKGSDFHLRSPWQQGEKGGKEVGWVLIPAVRGCCPVSGLAEILRRRLGEQVNVGNAEV